MVLPNFLILGAMKSGTTALCQYLKQHPQIFMSRRKEPQFFAFEGEKLDYCGPGDQHQIKRDVVTEFKAYCSLFDSVINEKAVGEASIVYLYSTKAPERIQHYVPGAKLIAILRHPAERAYSNFLHARKHGREPLANFGKALEEEEVRIRSNWLYFWHYKQLGLYHKQLKPYFDRFGWDKIRIYLYDDWKADNIGTIHDIFRFLEVEDGFVPDVSIKYRATSVPRFKALHRFFLEPNCVKSALKPFLPQGIRRNVVKTVINHNLVRSRLSEEIRQQLTPFYREDILKLQNLIQRDLSRWLE